VVPLQKVLALSSNSINALCDHAKPAAEGSNTKFSLFRDLMSRSRDRVTFDSDERLIILPV